MGSHGQQCRVAMLTSSLALAALAGGVSGPSAAGVARSAHSSRRGVVRSITGACYGFRVPDARVPSGHGLVAVNRRTNTGGRSVTWSLTEINPTAGALLRTISAPRYGGTRPPALAFSGNDLSVEDENDASVTTTRNGSATETHASSGTLHGARPSRALSPPAVMVSWGHDLVVANARDHNGEELVPEIAESTEDVGRVLADDHLADPRSLAVDGGRRFDAGGLPRGSVTDISPSTAVLARVLSDSHYGLDSPGLMLGQDSVLIVANDLTSLGAITMLDVRTEALLDALCGSRYRFDLPGSQVLSSGSLFLERTEHSGDGDRITEITVRGAVL